MRVYPTSANSTSPFWPVPIEPIWHMQSGDQGQDPRWKRPDLGLSERLFIGGILNLPPGKRPWGVVQWLADVYQTSRPTLYAIGARTKAGLLAASLDPAEGAEQKVVVAVPDDGPQVHVTRNRIQRTALTLLFPGGVSERSAAECLQAALGVERSPAYLS